MARGRIIFWAVLCVTLVFGLHPQDYDFQNNLGLSPQGTDLVFDRYGVAYTSEIFGEKEATLFAKQGFTLLLSLGRPEVAQDGYSIIAQIHSGADGSQLVIGRWSDYLIAMNGDDYRNTRGFPNITAKLPRTAGGIVSIAVSSSAKGSQIYLNGELANRDEGTVLQIPHLPRPGRIVLGNSVRGTQSWYGSIREFALFDRVLTPEEILSPPRSSADGNGLVRFRMERFSDNRVPNDLASRLESSALRVPETLVVVEPDILAWPFGHQFRFNRRFVSDLLINLLGFLPLGFVSALSARKSSTTRFGTAMLLAALVSLAIELAQAWMPSRDSSAFDLILNVSGAGLGALSTFGFGLVDRAKRP